MKSLIGHVLQQSVLLFITEGVEIGKMIAICSKKLLLLLIDWMDLTTITTGESLPIEKKLKPLESRVMKITKRFLFRYVDKRST